MKRLLVVLFLLVASAAAQVDSSAQEIIFDALNKARVAHGLKPLTLDTKLTDVAQQHSALMAKQHAISHQFYQEPGPTERIVGTGLRMEATGENVAVSKTAERAHKALMNSPPHRANILNRRFNAVGIGVIRDRDALYVTEDFARTVPTYTVEQAERRVADFVAQLRRSARSPELKLITNPQLRKLACDMAQADFLSMSNIRTLPGVSTTVVFTTADLSGVPHALAPLKTAPGTSMSVGVCYRATATHVIPEYWVAVVTYF